MTLKQRLWNDESRHGMVEYALMIGLITIGVSVVLLALRHSTGNALTTAADSLQHQRSSTFSTR